MARYRYDLVLNKPGDFVQFIMDDFLQKNHFTLTEYRGIPAYCSGDAMIEGYKYLKWSYSNGVFYIEAWLVGLAGTEMDLDGFVGTLQKKPFKDNLHQLYAALQQPVQMAQGQVQGGPQAVPVYTVDNTGAATMALVFGVCSILIGWLIPLLGLIFGILGITRARYGAGSSFAGRAKAGRICSVIGLCLSVLMWVLNMFVIFS